MTKQQKPYRDDGKNPYTGFDEAQTEEIIRLHEQGVSVRQIARQKGYALKNVSICLRLNNIATDRAVTHEATVARARQLRGRKIILAQDLMNDLEAIRERLFERTEMYMSTMDGVHTIELEEPQIKDQADLIRSLPQMVKAIDMLLMDTGMEETTEENKSALVDIMHNLRIVSENQHEQPPIPDENNTHPEGENN